VPETVEVEIRQLRALLWSDRDPDGRAFAPLADAYRRAGELEQALEVAREGVERLPHFGPGHLVAGRIHRDRGREEEAEACFRRALELDDENVHALHGLGSILRRRGDAEEAGELLERAAELGFERPPEDEPPLPAPPDPASTDDGPRTRTMAELYARQGLTERAVRIYESLLSEHPGDAALEARLAELRAGPTADEPVPTADEPAPAAVPARVDAPQTVSDFFASLLSWRGSERSAPAVSGAGRAVAGDVAAPGPGTAVVDIGRLAPEDIDTDVRPLVQIGALAPDDETPPLDISLLAPDDAG